jgi:ribonuclease R
VHAAPDPDPNNKGGYIVHVAIADVAFYVRPGSALDRDALTRGNSVYFPDRVVPMLPERISNDLCSLVPGEPRGALAVRMVIGPDGRKRSHSFHRVLMRSAAKLNYAQAQAAIDGGPTTPPAPAGADPEAALRGLCAGKTRARRARSARSRSARAENPAQARWHVDRVIVPERLDAHR